LIAELNELLGHGQSPQAPAPGQATARPTGVVPAKPASTVEESARAILAKTLGKTRAIDLGYSETLAGMLAARKGDYAEAQRAYRAALAAFDEAKNELEGAKTALKYATMILQKNSGGDNPDGRELNDAVDLLTDALPAFRGRSMLKELAEGERLLYALQRRLIRTR
jgi:hypothetical protein